MRFLALLLTLLTLAVATLTACGKDAAPASSGAASLAPTDAVVYAEATISPSGDQKQQLEDLLAKFPGGKDVGAKIEQALEDAVSESDGSISYKDDIKPWLGDDAAVFVGGFGVGSEPRDIAVLLATDDEDKALAAVKKSEPKAKQASYEDVDYITFTDDGDAMAAGTLDGWLVVGTISGFKSAVSASEGGGLAGTDQYEQALKGADEDRLGFVYVDTKALVDLAAGMPGGGQALKSFSGLTEPVVATVSADADGAEIAATVQTDGKSPFGPLIGEGSELLGDVPADAWLALGQPDLGKTIELQLDQLGDSVASKDQIEQQLRGATGLSLDEALGWMGDFSLFVRGETLSELGGALVVQTTDEADSAKTLKAIQRLASSAAQGTQVRPLGIPGNGFMLTGPELPQPIYLYQRDGHVVIAYGKQAAEDALDAPEKLADSSDFKAASAALGDGYGVSTYLAIAPILKLVDSTPLAGQADYQQAKRYLEPLGALIAGSKQDGDSLASVLRLTVP
ncbi:MAG TPA: DUF3352 domain-containing protein [Thermoleophilaceae bacterium]